MSNASPHLGDFALLLPLQSLFIVRAVWLNSESLGQVWLLLLSLHGGAEVTILVVFDGVHLLLVSKELVLRKQQLLLVVRVIVLGKQVLDVCRTNHRLGQHMEERLLPLGARYYLVHSLLPVKATLGQGRAHTLPDSFPPFGLGLVGQGISM